MDLYDWGNMSFPSIDKTLKNVAESLTNYIRDNANVDHSTPAEGQVLHYATCLDVRWPIIVVHALLITSTLMFFVFVLASTLDHRMEIWKSSPLPLLFRGLRYGQGERQSNIIDEKKQSVHNSLAAMERLSKATIARLEHYEPPAKPYERSRRRSTFPDSGKQCK